jgi:hypothetical protein
VEAGVVGKSSFSTMQSIVALVAGLSSIVGAAYSAVGSFRAAPASGDVVAVVRDATTAEPVPSAVIEVLTSENALVTTMTPGDDGLARRTVPPGTYRIRVAHPAFVEQARDVQVTPNETTEVRLALAHRARGTSAARAAPAPAPTRTGDPIVDGATHAVDRGVSVGRRLLGRLGF